ncbi:MAG: DUF499 domain-containing protein, partial [Infirmifilum sp.]
VLELRSRYLSLYGDERQVFGAAAVERALKLDKTAPFHPSYLEVLYDIVTRSPELQRTRDALRITRHVVRRILQSGEYPDFVMPWHIDLADDRLRGLLTQSFASFGPVVDKDLLGRALKADANRLMYKVALSIFLRTYVYGSVVKPERAFPTREDVAFMVYEEGFARGAGVKPADVLNALEAAAESLLYLQERDGRYWFNPMPSVIEMVEDEAKRVGSVEARRLFLETVESLAEGPPPGVQKREAIPRLFKCAVRSEPLPIDEEVYYLVIAPEKLSESEVRRIIFEREGGGSRVYRNTVAVLYPKDEHRLKRLLEICGRLVACERIREQLKEIYPEDARELQGKKLRDYEKRLEDQLYNEVLAAFDTVAYPSGEEVKDGKVYPRKTSLARIAEDALASPDVGKAKIDRLDFEELDYILRSIGVDISKGEKELPVKELISYFYTNTKLPFVVGDLVLHALREGVSRLKVGLQRGGEVIWARVYREGEQLPAAPEGRAPESIMESDIVLPWNVAARRLLERLSKVERKEVEGKVVQISYALRCEGREIPLSELLPDQLELLKSCPIVERREVIGRGLILNLEPSALELEPGAEAVVSVSVEPVGQVGGPVQLSVDEGVVEPDADQPPLSAKWKLRAPQDEGRFVYKVSASAPGLEKATVRELVVSVRRAGPPLLRELVFDDFNEFERLVQSGGFGPVVLSEGKVELEQGGQHASLAMKGVDPASFVGVARMLMSAMQVYAPRSFTARVELKKPLELTEEVKRKLSKYKVQWR